MIYFIKDIKSMKDISKESWPTVIVLKVLKDVLHRKARGDRKP